MLSATTVDWQDNSVTFWLASFLVNYWSYNFDTCSNCLVNLCRRLLWTSDIACLPVNYDIYDIDGFMYSITECVQAACNEGNFYNPSSNEYKTSVVLLASYLAQGSTNEPQTDPNKGTVSKDMSERASHAARALWHLSVVLHRDSVAGNVRSSELPWLKFVNESNHVTDDETLNTENRIVALGHVLAEAAATKFAISSSDT